MFIEDPKEIILLSKYVCIIKLKGAELKTNRQYPYADKQFAIRSRRVSKSPFIAVFPFNDPSHVSSEDGSGDRRIFPIRFAAAARTEADRLSVDSLITPGIPVGEDKLLSARNNNLQHRGSA